MTALFVCLGGALGALSRHGLVSMIPLSSYITILIVNCIGSFIIGWLYKDINTIKWSFFAIGFCGAFTTFSTYSLDSITFLLNSQWKQLFSYMLLSNSLCLLMCWLGLQLKNI